MTDNELKEAQGRVFERISKQTGHKPVQCNCERCKEMCHTPCLGTPHDILLLIKAGYADRLAYTEWLTGYIMGFTKSMIPMVQIKKEGNWCNFYHEGICELHDKGLKPTEGRLAYHEVGPREIMPEYNLTFQVAKEWNDQNLDIIKEITDKLIESYNR